MTHPLAHFTHTGCINVQQLTLEDINALLDRAKTYAHALKESHTQATGKVIATVFLEPSTRTRMSFESAALRLGAQVITMSDAANSSVKKGETLEDTIRVISAYADAIVLRSPEDDAADRAANVSPIPVINAGSGKKSHPTQALLDLFTLFRRFGQNGTLPQMNVTFVGDLKYGRTVHSLSTLLRHWPQVHQTFVAVDALQMPESYRRAEDTLTHTLTPEILQQTQVAYATRVQQERFPSVQAYNEVKDAFIWTPELVSHLPESSLLLHPLPRIHEITHDVDEMPQAHYFQQAANGVPMRMAILSACLGLE